MNAVVFYSNSNESKKIAKYLGEKSNYEIFDLRLLNNFNFNNLIVVFPVYCQNIPDEVKEFIKKIRVNNISVVATYGRKSFGNVIYELSKLNKLNIISYAYIPTKHTYIENDSSFEDYSKLDCLVGKFNKPSTIKIKKHFKNPFASILMLKRSQSNIKIVKNENCNGCNICANCCSNIYKGRPNEKCIRCLRCVNRCPNKSLYIKKSFVLKMYLKLVYKNKLIIKV